MSAAEITKQAMSKAGTCTATKATRKHPDRVTLPTECIVRLDHWIHTVTKRHRGVVISRNEMLQWVLENRSSEFTAEEIENLKSKFQNEISLLKHVMQELRLRKSNGEKVTALEIMASLQS